MGLLKFQIFFGVLEILDIFRVVDAGPDPDHTKGRKNENESYPPSPGTCNHFYVTSIRFYKEAQSTRLFGLAGWLTD